MARRAPASTPWVPFEGLFEAGFAATADFEGVVLPGGPWGSAAPAGAIAKSHAQPNPLAACRGSHVAIEATTLARELRLGQIPGEIRPLRKGGQSGGLLERSPPVGLRARTS
jgi:hypothetical protein